MARQELYVCDSLVSSTQASRGHAFLDLVAAMLCLSAAGTVYFSARKRLTGYERQYVWYVHALALLWSAVPLVTGDWLWCVLTFPIGQALARMAIASRERNAL